MMVPLCGENRVSARRSPSEGRAEYPGPIMRASMQICGMSQKWLIRVPRGLAHRAYGQDEEHNRARAGSFR